MMRKPCPIILDEKDYLFITKQKKRRCKVERQEGGGVWPVCVVGVAVVKATRQFWPSSSLTTRALLARQWIGVLGICQMLPKGITCALRPELLGSVAACIHKDIGHIPATILVAGDDEVPDVTRIRLSIRSRECLALAMGITEDNERCPCREGVDDTKVGTWPVPPVRTAGDVVPNVTAMIMNGHNYASLLLSSQRRD